MQTELSGKLAMAAQREMGGTAPSPRLARSAREFEGQMMKELLQPLTSDDSLTGAEDDSDSSMGSGGALGEFASEALGRALSVDGGFGIADRIIRALSPAGNQHRAASVTQNSHGNTGIKSSNH